MITTYKITNTWQPITAAGESGVAWCTEIRSGRKGKADVFIYHTTGDAPTGNEKLLQSKKLYIPSGNNDFLRMSADNSNDIFYARTFSNGAEAKINVDVVS